MDRRTSCCWRANSCAMPTFRYMPRLRPVRNRPLPFNTLEHFSHTIREAVRFLRIPGLVFVTATLWPALLCAAERDALAIENTLRLRHLPYDTVLDPVLGANRIPVSYT